MKVLMDVSGVRELDDYIESNTVPMIVCTPPSGVNSRAQQKFLDKYYDKIVDRRGWSSYYCNIINAGKCRDMNYETIMQTSGKEEKIRDFGLKKSAAVKGKYIVAVRYQSGKIVDGVSLVKTVRLKAETKKKQLNGIKKR